VIPYKNPPALISYYLGIFSILLGPLLGIPAIILGIVGLRNRARNPQIKGTAHAWVGIIMGGLMTFIYLSVIIVLIVISNTV